MKRKKIEQWSDFVDMSGEFLVENMHKSRVTFKYRNKRPSRGKLYVTNDNKSYFTKLTEKKDLDKLETYLSGVLHILANKPIEKVEEKKEEKTQKKSDNKKKNKKKK